MSYSLGCVLPYPRRSPRAASRLPSALESGVRGARAAEAEVRRLQPGVLRRTQGRGEVVEGAARGQVVPRRVSGVAGVS